MKYWQQIGLVSDSGNVFVSCSECRESRGEKYDDAACECGNGKSQVGMWPKGCFVIWETEELEPANHELEKAIIAGATFILILLGVLVWVCKEW